MPITERTATVAESASATSITGMIPVGTLANDVMVAVYGMTCTAAQFTGPAGWTQLFAPQDFGAAECFAAYQKVASGADAGPLGNTSAAAGRCTCIVQSYLGVNTASPIDAAAVLTTATAGSITLTGVTTVTNGAMVVSAVSGNWSTGTWTQPAAMTLRANHTSGVGRALALADVVQAVAGATGTLLWSDTAGALALIGFVAALKPASAGSGAAVLGAAPLWFVKRFTPEALSGSLPRPRWRP